MSGPICASKSSGCGFVDSRAVTSVAVMVAVLGAGSTGRSNCTSSGARKECRQRSLVRCQRLQAAPIAADFACLPLSRPLSRATG